MGVLQVLALLASGARGDVASPLSYVFSSHMVLQRDGAGAAVFGRTLPGERVSVLLDAAASRSPAASRLRPTDALRTTRASPIRLLHQLLLQQRRDEINECGGMPA